MNTKRGFLAGSLAAFAAMALLAATPVHAKETVTFGYLADPSHEAVLWPLRNGKVKSDLIDVQATGLQISALIQATSARTYDVIETAAMAIPRAREHGLDLQIMGTGLRYHTSGEGAGIWVKKDSPIKSIADLKGKRLAVYSLGSAGITLVRIALHDVYGLNVALKGGDLDFVEMPAPAMPAALATGKVDAAALIHAQAYKANQTGEFRPIAQTAQDLNNKFHLRMVSAVLAGYGEKLKAKPEIYREFQRVLHASMEYARSHPDEVFPAVGKEFNIDPGFFQAWFSRFSDFPVVLSDQDVKAIALLWDKAKELDILKSYPPVQDTIWKDALTENALAK
ncbi:MAG TPA: MqnA/MqnD/SBP family protein [Pseudolabrys sp.]|jgi:NitT/TauT family transport system substrate-binding protein